MGDIILFRPRTGQSGTRAADATRVGAQIMFFTGVRYERMKETVPAVVAGEPPAGGVGGAGRGKRRRGA